MTVQTILQNVGKWILAFESPGLYLLVCLAGFFLILIFGKKKGRTAFVYPLILFVLALFNPYVYNILLSGTAKTDAADQILWAVPFALIAVTGLFCLCGRLAKKLPRLFAVLIFLACLVLTGTPAVTDAGFYNVSADSVTGKNEGTAIADLISGNMKNDTADVYVEDEEMASSIRMENAGLFCSLGKKNSVTKESAGEIEADFFVAETGGKSEKALSSVYTLIGRSRHYSIYKK